MVLPGPPSSHLLPAAAVSACPPVEDEWPIKSSRFNGDRGPVLIQQHRTTAQRCAAAAAFAADFGISGMQVLVDPVPGEEEGQGPGATADEAASAGGDEVQAAPAGGSSNTAAAQVARGGSGEEEGDQQEEGPAELSDGAGAGVAAAAASGGQVRGAEAGGSCDTAAAQVAGASVPAKQQSAHSQQEGVGPAGGSGKPVARDAFVVRACTGQQQEQHQHAASSAPPQTAPPAVQLSCSSGSCGGRRVVGYGNSGPFDAALAPWPLRFYVVDRAGLLLLKADPKDCSYDLFQLWDWLEQQRQVQ